MTDVESQLKAQIACYLASVQRQKQREQLLTRKYGTLYLTKVFPHVTPSAATRLYELRLLRTAFSTLKASWWLERVWWRLELRARCHRHLHVTRRAVDIWRRHVRACRADRHFRTTASRRALRRLREICQTLRRVRQEAKRLLHVYVVLTERMEALMRTRGLVDARMNVIVFVFGRRRLFYGCLVAWKAVAESQRTSRLRLRALSAARMQRTALAAWRSVVERRRPVRRRLAASARHLNEALTADCFWAWVRCCLAAEQRRQLATQLLARLDSDQLQRCLERWRAFPHTCRAERWADAIADRALATRCFAALRRHGDKMVAWRTANRTAWVRRCWVAWINHVAARWRERNAEKIQRADRRLRRSDLCKALAAWRRHVARRRRKRALSITAEHLFARRWFGAWHDQMQRCQHIRQLEAQAEAFREFTCLREALAIWQQRYAASARSRELLELATSLVASRLVARSFHAWQRWAAECVTERQRSDEATRYRDLRLTLNCWTTWTDRVAEQRRRDALLARAVELRVATVTRRAWGAWSELQRCRREARRRAEQSACAKDMEVAAQVLRAWSLAAIDCRRARQRVADVTAWHERRVARGAFRQLRGYVAHRRERREDERRLAKWARGVEQAFLRRYFDQWELHFAQAVRVRQHHETKLISWAMTTWLTNHRQRVELRARTMALRETSLKFALSRCFATWLSRCQQRASQRLLESRACERWQRSLLCTCLRSWLRFSVLRKRDREKEMERERRRTDLLRWEQRERWALDHVLRVARHEFHLARKYFTRWTSRLAKKRGLPYFKPITAEPQEHARRFCPIRDELNVLGRRARPISSLGVLARPKPRIPAFLQRKLPIGCEKEPISERDWGVGDMAAGDAGYHGCVGLLPPAYFAS